MTTTTENFSSSEYDVNASDVASWSAIEENFFTDSDEMAQALKLHARIVDRDSCQIVFELASGELVLLTDGGIELLKRSALDYEKYLVVDTHTVVRIGDTLDDQEEEWTAADETEE